MYTVNIFATFLFLFISSYEGELYFLSAMILLLYASEI